MKKNILVAMIVLIGIACSVNAANDKVETSNRFISESLMKAGTSEKPETIKECISEMKRIVKFCPENWLTYYYISLYNLRYVLNNSESDFTNALEEVNQTLPQLESCKGADLSEVYTLKGMYQYIYLVKHPSSLGKATYNKMLASFDKAIELKPSNPRAQMFKFVVQYLMGKSLGYEMTDEKAQIDKVTRLLNEEHETIPYPSWGKEIWKVLMNR